jgi:hypothetical protein
MRWHHADMTLPSPALKWALLGLACVSLSACAGGPTAGERMADLPHWMGGEPAGVPPRRGTPEYDAWMAARAEQAVRPKTDSPRPDQPK